MNWTLAAAHGKQLLRDRRSSFAVVLVPLFFLALAVGLGVITPPAPGASGGTADLTRFLLPGTLFVSLAAVALLGTVVPAVELRRKGTLRLLSTTPLSPGTFLLSLVPLRVVLALGFVILLAAVSAAYGYLPPTAPLLLVTAVFGIAFLLALGFVFAAVLPSGEVAENVLSLVLVVVAIAGGSATPLDSLPGGIGSVLEWLPPALLVDALRAELVGIAAPHPEWLSWLLLAAWSAALSVFAVRFFRWNDQPG